MRILLVSLLMVVLAIPSPGQLGFSFIPGNASQLAQNGTFAYNAFPVGPFKLGGTCFLYNTESQTHASDRAVQVLRTTTDPNCQTGWTWWAGPNSAQAGDQGIPGICESNASDSFGFSAGIVEADGVTLLLTGYNSVPAGSPDGAIYALATASNPCPPQHVLGSTSPAITMLFTYDVPTIVPGGGQSTVCPSGCITILAGNTSAGLLTYLLICSNDMTSCNAAGNGTNVQDFNSGFIGEYAAAIPSYECAKYWQAPDTIQLFCRWDFCAAPLNCTFQTPYTKDMGAHWFNPDMRQMFTITLQHPPNATDTLSSTTIPAPTIVPPAAAGQPYMLLYSERNVWNKQGGGVDDQCIIHQKSFYPSQITGAIGTWTPASGFLARSSFDLTGQIIYSNTTGGGIDCGYQGQYLNGGSMNVVFYSRVAGNTIELIQQPGVLACGGANSCNVGLSATGMSMK